MIDDTRGPALFLAGDGELIVVDVDRAKSVVHELPQLAPGDPRYRMIRREDKLVLWGGDRALAGDTYVLDLDLDAPPTKLGDSWYFIPSVASDRVWLAVRDTDSSAATVREVSIDGSVTSPDVALPGDRSPAAAVGDSLVFEDRRGGLELWNPQTREVTHRLQAAELGPTQGDLLTWCEPGGRRLHVMNVITTQEQVFTPPRGSVAYECGAGAYAPNGKLLAVPTHIAGTQSNRSLAIIDLDSGVAAVTAGSRVASDYLFVVWSGDGDRVFFSGGDNGRSLVQYRPGEPRAVRMPVEVQDFYAMVST